MQKFKDIFYGILDTIIIFIGVGIIMIPMIFFSFLKLIIPIKRFRFFCVSALQKASSLWVDYNLLMTRLLSPTKIKIDCDTDLDIKKSYLIISNHQSWLDTLILQLAFHKNIVFPKFFMKFQIFFVPILGLVCWGLEFPAMRRYSKEYLNKNPHKKGEDIRRTKEYCQNLPLRPTTIVNFVEGTRYTNEKAKKSDYKKLLNPKAGGIAVVLNSLGDRLDGILNTTLIYESENESLWRFLCRKTKNITVKVEFIPIKDIPIGNYFENDEDKKIFQQWINDIWQKKDNLINQNKN